MVPEPPLDTMIRLLLLVITLASSAACLHAHVQNVGLASDALLLMSAEYVNLAAASAAWLAYRGELGEQKHLPNRNYYKECLKQPAGQFQSNFRMSKQTYHALETRLWDERSRKRKRKGRPPKRSVFRRKLLTTLWFLATGDASGASIRGRGEAR